MRVGMLIDGSKAVDERFRRSEPEPLTRDMRLLFQGNNSATGCTDMLHLQIGVDFQSLKTLLLVILFLAEILESGVVHTMLRRRRPHRLLTLL